jgi:hypothetical protein
MGVGSTASDLANSKIKSDSFSDHTVGSSVWQVVNDGVRESTYRNAVVESSDQA